MKSFISLIIGSALTFLFLKYGYSPPETFQLPEKLKAIPEQLIASSFVEDANSNLKQRQKAVATLIKFDPNYFIEIDNAIGNRFTQQAVDKIADRRILLLKNYSENIAKAFDKAEHPALRKRLEERYGVEDEHSLKRKVLLEKLHEDKFVSKVIRQRYPGYSDEEIADIILEGQ
ncbi:MAG: hypothetical protein GY860_16955 [Desulfobacteraceae bacterium]|nr:hypothetical protein [Desulfobacteraceae bacterium]